MISWVLCLVINLLNLPSKVKITYKISQKKIWKIVLLEVLIYITILCYIKFIIIYLKKINQANSISLYIYLKLSKVVFSICIAISLSI